MSLARGPVPSSSPSPEAPRSAPAFRTLALGLGLASLAFLAGCKAPGMKMNVRPSGAGSTQEIGGMQVSLYPITPQLVTAQKAAPAPLPSDLVGLMVAKPQPYRIGPQDILLAAVWDHPEISMPMGPNRTDSSSGHLVDDAGCIFFPYVGAFKVGGMTVSEARDALTAKLAPVLRNPQLDLKVLAFRSQKIYVGGEVRTPAVYTVTDVPFTLAEAVNRAGGFTAAADDSRMLLTRGNRQWLLNFPALLSMGSAFGQLVLQDGDALVVPNTSDDPVYLMGEVGRPGNVPMVHGNLSLARALSDAGGILTTSSDATSIYVVRAGKAANAAEVFHLDGRNPASMVLADKFRLQPHDIVYVDAGTLIRFSRVMNNIIPTLSVVTQVGLSGAEIKFLKAKNP